MKVIILAGGSGSRLGDITKIIPKPLVKIGKFPILVHIISIYLNIHLYVGIFVTYSLLFRNDNIFSQVCSTPQANGVTIPSPVTTTLFIKLHLFDMRWIDAFSLIYSPIPYPHMPFTNGKNGTLVTKEYKIFDRTQLYCIMD